MVHFFRCAYRTIFITALCAFLTGAVAAQETASLPDPSSSLSSSPHVGIIQDWSTQHVIYTRNGSLEDMWKVREDPRFMSGTLLRYMREQCKRTGQPEGFALNGAPGAGEGVLEPIIVRDPLRPRPTPPRKNKHSKVDWSVSLGPTAGMAVGETPAVFTYNYVVPSCSNLSATPPSVGDFAVYTINATPSTTAGSGQANLVGLTNLYTDGAGAGFCSGTAPTFFFSYAIGSGPSPLSPVLSLDGTKVAWIENRTANDAYLHVTIWAANQGGDATAPAAALSGTFSNGVCTGGSSCDFALEYTNTTASGCATAHVAGNSHSDLYVDYGSGGGFISANNGLLYHISNIFSSTAAPTVDFCTTVNSGASSGAMSGPIYDVRLGKVFITDSENIYSYTFSSSLGFSPATPASYKYASSYSYETGPGPLLDAFNNYLYLFSTDDAAGNTSVTQVTTSLSTHNVTQLGPKTTNATPFLFYGAFDNNYYNYGPAYGTNPASTLYSCGTDSTTNAQDLFAISFNSSTGVVNTTPAMSSNRNVNAGGTKNGVCSPLTEFFDGKNDRLFVGMGEPGSNTGANIVTMWNIGSQLTNTSGPGGTMPTYSAIATGYLGGTSGMAADNNDSSTAEAESIYFSTEYAGSSSTLVPTTTAYNENDGIVNNGFRPPCTGGLDNDGNAYASNLLGTTVTWNGTTFDLGPADGADFWSNTTITLPSGEFSTLTILAAAVNVTNSGYLSATFTVNYTDGTTTPLTQSISDWYNPLGFGGESIAKSTAYRYTCNGTEGTGPFDLFGYSFAINPNKTVSTLTLPATRDVVVLAAALSNNCGGADYCAVKLTQGALQ